MYPQFPRASSAPRPPEQSSSQPPSPMQQSSGSTSATLSAVPDLARRSALLAGPSLQSLPPRSSGALPSLQQRQGRSLLPTPSQPSLSFVEAGASEAVADLTMFREQVPQLEGEKKAVYARRLHLAHPQLTLKQISQLSRITESNLKRDPAFQAADLARIREQLPQREGESNPAYARRLHLAHPHLTVQQISQLSGVSRTNLRRDPAFQELPADLAHIREQVPQLEGEKNRVYARRLYVAHPQLTLSQISLLSGVIEGNLKLDPAFQELPAELAPIREQFPQLEGENNQAYARRLHVARPQLTLPQISQLSGVIEASLKRDPAFQELPAKLAPIREQFPQLEGENNQTYARRLHVARPQLTLPQISQLSGVTESYLKRDPTFQDLPADLAPIREQVPQLEGEKNAAYARRLHLARPQLTLPQISQLSGVAESNLKQDPAFRGLPADLAPIREQVPPLEDEKNAAYARRLHLARPQLTLPQISLLSGVIESNLRRDPAFRELPADLAPIREQVPQLEGEKNPDYARRLHLAHPQLTLPQISLLSGVIEFHLKQALAVGQRRPLSTSVEAANRARSESSARRPGGLKRTASEAAAAQPASNEVPIPSEPSRLTEPSGSLSLVFDGRVRMPPAWEGLADVARPSELAAHLMPTDLPGPAIAEDSEMFALIDGGQQLPSELHFMAQPPDSRGRTIGAAPAARVEMPLRVTPAAALLQIQPQHIEAAITALRQGRFGLNREEIEQAVGLPAGVLAAVVDAQGNWLSQAALSDAVADLLPAQVQAFAMTLEQMRANVPQFKMSREAPARNVRPRLTGPSGSLSPVFDGQARMYAHDNLPGPAMAEDSEIAAMIDELQQPGELYFMAQPPDSQRPDDQDRR